MALWEVQRRPGKIYTERQLARRLLRGKLLPDDAVRPVGEEGWRAAREAAAVPGALAGAHEGWMLVQGLLWHVGVWASVSYFVHLPTVVVVVWGIGVAAHTIQTVSRFVFTGPRRMEDAEAGASSAASAGTPASAGDRRAAPAAPPAADPFLAELSAVLDDLERIARERALPGAVDLAALRTSAQELRRRHLDVARLGDAATRERLAGERDAALAQAAAATDPRTVEVLRDQARSVSGRLESMREAAEAAARLEARERTLLHQVESLRLALLRSGADEAQAPELADEARRLEAALRAEAEVDSTLAAARLRRARQPEG